MAFNRMGPQIMKYSRASREANEWGRKLDLEEKAMAPRDEFCRCGRHAVEGPRYMKQRSCRICGKFMR